MRTLILNREFAVRHLSVALLMLGLGCWFGYDGYVNYPRQPESWFSERHLQKENAIQRQKEFMLLAFLAALVIAGHVWLVARLRFEFDDESYVYKGVRKAFSKETKVDWSKWESKRIVKVDGITLDAWHHTGVHDVVDCLKEIG